MPIVDGHRAVDPTRRASYLAGSGSASVVERARRPTGCLDFAITADLINPARVNLFERWESQTAVKAFRRRAPHNKQGAAMRSASMAEYDIADVRPLSRKWRA